MMRQNNSLDAFEVPTVLENNMASSHLGPNPVRSRPILPEKTSGNSWQLVTKKFTSCHLSLTCLHDLLPCVFS